MKAATRKQAATPQTMARQLLALAADPLEQHLDARRLRHVGEHLPAPAMGPAWCESLQAGLAVQPRWRDRDRDRLPRRGPAILVVDRPFSLEDSLVVAAALGELRADVRILGNSHPHQLGRLNELFFWIDPLGRYPNRRSLRAAVRWVQGGGTLVLFAGGTGSRFGRPRWARVAATLMRTAGAQVVPMSCRRGSRVMDRVRRLASLARPAGVVDLRVGNPVSPATLTAIDDSRALLDYLRFRCDLMRVRNGAAATTRPVHGQEPVAAAGGADGVAADVAALPPECLMLTSGDCRVYVARAPQLPHLLPEIGRLRELTFRAVGEGTGKAVDLDACDDYYLHLFVWNTVDHDIVGAYRLGPTDEILAARGPDGFYSSSIFRYDPAFFARLNPGMELGRSFVQPRYQKSYSSLLLLWRGICTYVARHPRYRYLFGPVSISADYHDRSRQVLARFLHGQHFATDLAHLVAATHPFRIARQRRGRPDPAAADIEEIATWITDIEGADRGIPILVRQYLKMGARFLEFNVDPDFADCLDGLIVVDLPAADAKALTRYMGREAYAAYLAHWQVMAQ